MEGVSVWGMLNTKGRTLASDARHIAEMTLSVHELTKEPSWDAIQAKIRVGFGYRACRTHSYRACSMHRAEANGHAL